MYRTAGVALLIGMGWMSAGAQRVETAPSYAPLELSFNYSYARSNAAPGECGCFNMNGGSSEVAIHALRASAPGRHVTLLTSSVGAELAPFLAGETHHCAHRSCELIRISDRDSGVE